MNRAVTLTAEFIICSPAHLQFIYLQQPSGKGFLLSKNKHIEVAFSYLSFLAQASERDGYTWGHS